MQQQAGHSGPYLQVQPAQQQQRVPSNDVVSDGGSDSDSSASGGSDRERPMCDEDKAALGRVDGYANFVDPNVTFVPPPPTYKEAVAQANDTADSFGEATAIGEDEARRCLLQHVERQCCWGKGAAEALEFKEITLTSAVHYMLESFVETRSTDWKHEPFTGQHVDGPQNGKPPAPWEMQVATPPWFDDQVYKIEVPHTAKVLTCSLCHGATVVTCHRCHGRGRHRCHMCHGSGERGVGDQKRRCISCHGSGKQRCRKCSGRGVVPCKLCAATGQLKHFIQLTVLFKTHTADFILERTDLPDYLIRDVSGKTLFEDTQPMLHPIHAFPEQQVNSQSASLIQQHRALSQTGRIWCQRHVIRSVPVQQCDCKWKDKPLQFFVYGDDKKVHAAGYPQTCCWGCQLL